jgi:hypothetical protein
MSLKKIIKEEVDSFQWIRDIQSSYPQYFHTRVEDFINRYATHWEGAGVFFEPIGERYESSIGGNPNVNIELGRVWLDDNGGSWYWDLIKDETNEVFRVELFEKLDGEPSYEIVDSSNFKTFEEALEWIYDGMIEG